jgi:hypothetical protein
MYTHLWGIRLRRIAVGLANALSIWQLVEDVEGLAKWRNETLIERGSSDFSAAQTGSS